MVRQPLATWLYHYDRPMGFEDDMERRVAARRTDKVSIAEQAFAAFKECMQRWSELVDAARQSAALLISRGAPFSPDPWLFSTPPGIWPEGWRLNAISSGPYYAVLTIAGEIKTVHDDCDSYQPTRDEKDYLEGVRNNLADRHWAAVNHPHPYNESSLHVLVSQSKRLTTSSNVVILEALMDEVADLLL